MTDEKIESVVNWLGNKPLGIYAIRDCFNPRNEEKEMEMVEVIKHIEKHCLLYKFGLEIILRTNDTRFSICDVLGTVSGVPTEYIAHDVNFKSKFDRK